MGPVLSGTLVRDSSNRPAWTASTVSWTRLLTPSGSTIFATAYFGEDIDRVRWKAKHTRANDFEHRLYDEQ